MRYSFLSPHSHAQRLCRRPTNHGHTSHLVLHLGPMDQPVHTAPARRDPLPLLPTLARCMLTTQPRRVVRLRVLEGVRMPDTHIDPPRACCACAPSASSSSCLYDLRDRAVAVAPPASVHGRPRFKLCAARHVSPLCPLPFACPAAAVSTWSAQRGGSSSSGHAARRSGRQGGLYLWRVKQKCAVYVRGGGGAGLSSQDVMWTEGGGRCVMMG